MLPAAVVAEVTIKPPAVSETLIAPVPVTFNVALVAAVLTLIPVPPVIDTAVPDTSAVLSIVAVTDVPADNVKLPLADAIDAVELSVIAPPEVSEMLPEVAATVAFELKTMLPLLPVVLTDKLFAPKLGLAPVANVTAPGESFSVIAISAL
jgi:hypothetical protein